MENSLEAGPMYTFKHKINSLNTAMYEAEYHFKLNMSRFLTDQNVVKRNVKRF